MPPRFAYWTILIDQKPTAFRARLREELLPTLAQLRRTNRDVIMKWCAHGRLWDSPEAQQEAERAHRQRPKTAIKRGGERNRPGGGMKRTLYSGPRSENRRDQRGAKKHGGPRKG